MTFNNFVFLNVIVNKVFAEIAAIAKQHVYTFKTRENSNGSRLCTEVDYLKFHTICERSGQIVCLKGQRFCAKC